MAGQWQFEVYEDDRRDECVEYPVGWLPNLDHLTGFTDEYLPTESHRDEESSTSFAMTFPGKRNKDPLCAQCRRIKQLLLFPEGGHEADSWDGQGTTVTVLVSGSGCSSCGAISRILAILGVQEQITQLSFAVIPTKAVQCLRAVIDKGTALYLQPSDTQLFLTEFDPTHLSTDFSKTSIQHCMHEHAQACSKSQTIQHAKDLVSIYLIDLDANCLVRASTRKKYAALSYVWGSSQSSFVNIKGKHPKTTLSRMQESGFFLRNSKGIPRTVRQAMTFTRVMGMKYLWVDRYCIPQDDQSEKHSQLRAMGSIYYQAHFVIIAAEGDGIHGLCTDDYVRSEYRSYSNELKAGLGVVYEPTTENTRWSTRGWTFQEQLFARRSFVFRENTVTFQCQQSTWQEGTKTPLPHATCLTGSRATKLTIDRWPNMLHLKDLVEEYTERKLSHPCDSLDAFAGILDALESSFPNGFLFGISEVCFDISLLWQPKGVLADRLALAIADNKPLADLPSWSWARWEGPIDCSAWEAAAECLFLSYYNQSFYNVFTIVNWQKTSRSSGALVPLSNNYNALRNLAKDSSLPPPLGWKRQALRSGFGQDGQLSRLLRNTNHRFTHSTLGQNRLFRFPVPLPSSTSEVVDDQSWTPRVHGRVQRAFLSMITRSTPRKQGGRWHAIERRLQPGRKLQVGVVQLHDSKLETATVDEVSGEFIAISAGEFFCVPGESVGVPRNTFDEWELKWQGIDSHIYEFYNVMLIEHRGELSIRKGLGRVQKALWESLEREEIEVVLA